MIKRAMSVAGILVVVGSLAAPASAQPASAQPAAVTPVSARITSAGGINVVPTPAGLGLGGSTELLQSSCAIGAGCAARTWQKFIGTDANNPDAVITMQSNVGVLPTFRLAQRDQLAVAQQFGTYAANGGFVGSIRLSDWRGLRVLVVSGRFDQTVDDYVQLVQVKQGRRTVMISVNLDNRTSELTMPARASIRNLVIKARTALQQSWRSVPTTVLP